MTTNYPSALDTTAVLKNDAVDATVAATTHKTHHNNIADALIAIETELGVNPSGSFATVLLRLAGLISKTPTANQTIQSSGDFQQLGLRRFSGQTVNLLEIQNSASAVQASWDENAVLDVNAITQGGAALASTHLSDTANILKNPSPAITTPTISTATLTGVPTAPTPSVDDNTTKIATTAFVINQGYARPASPTFTGTPTAPTASPGDDSTKIATTAFVVGEILANQVSGIPSGAVTPFSGATAPDGWILCDGTAVSRTTYADLFTAVGTTFGVGDGSTTFNVPDLRGRSPVGKGTHVDVDTVGESDGISEATRRPHHAHTPSFSASSDPGAYHNHSYAFDSQGSHSHSYTSVSSGGAFTGGGTNVGTGSTGSSTGSGGSHSHTGGSLGSEGHGHSVTGSIGSSGIDDTHAFIVINYIIKA